MAFFNKNPKFENIVSGNPIKGKDKKYFVALSLKDEGSTDDIMCQIGPKMVLKSQMEEEATSFEVIFNKPEVKDFLQECDDHILSLCKDNKNEWFPGDSEISDGYLDNAIMSSTKQIKKSENVVMKIRTSNKMNIFDNSKTEINRDKLEEESKVSVIVQLAGIWFTKTRFGITWKAKQIKLHNEKVMTCGEYLFEDAEDEELENVFPDD